MVHPPRIMRRLILSLGIALAGIFLPLGGTVLAACDIVTDEATIVGFPIEIRTTCDDDSSTLKVRITDPDGEDVFLVNVRLDERGDASTEFTPVRAGIYDVTLRRGDSSTVIASASFDVFAGSPDKFTLAVEGGEAQAGKENILCARVFDEDENPLEGRMLSIFLEGSGLAKLEQETDARGEQCFRFEPESAGTVEVNVVDPVAERSEVFEVDVAAASGVRKKSPLSASLLDEFESEEEEGNGQDLPRYGFIDAFEISIEAQVRAHDPVDMEVRAVDKDGEIVRDYVGRIVIETTDGEAQVPLKPRVFASNQGKVFFPLGVSFANVGEQTITVFDEGDPDIRGSATVRVSGGTQPIERGHIVVTTPKSPATVSKSPVPFTVKAPAYINIDVFLDGTKVLSGASNEDGTLSVSVPIDLAKTTQEVVFREGEGGLDRSSLPVTLTVDATPPVLKDVLLLPDTATPGGSFTVTVTAESGQEVSASLPNTATVPLREGSIVKEGLASYVMTMKAPEQPGTYPVTVVLRDSAGNEVREVKSLTVSMPGLPIVSQPQVLVTGHDVSLSWQGVQGASSYRIYFGSSALDLSRHVETGSPVTAVQLRGIPSGETFFALTALDAQGQESIARSPLVSATVQGSLFDVRLEPLVNGARLRWKMPEGMHVRAYRIQYGIGEYSEQRIITPEHTTLDLPDLINGLSYKLAFSALLEDNTLLSEPGQFTVTPGQDGKPGMHLGLLDPLPVGIGTRGPSAPSTGHSAAPRVTPRETPGSGMPLWVAGLISLMSLLILGALTPLLAPRLLVVVRKSRRLSPEISPVPACRAWIQW